MSVERVLSDSVRAAEMDRAFAALGQHGVPPDLCLVLGGDGTMLKAIHRFGGEKRYLGVNCGYLGFLMNDADGAPIDVAQRVLHAVRQDAYTAHCFPRLGVRVRLASEEVMEHRAVNDVYVERHSGQTVHLRVTVDGVVAVERLVCDGLIASTPLGSTAYSFSAGGPAAHPLVRAIQVTAICPHNPRLAPLVLPFTSRVMIEVLDPVHRPARVVVDGAQHGLASRVEARGVGDDVTLCFLEGHDFTATMIRKILKT